MLLLYLQIVYPSKLYCKAINYEVFQMNYAFDKFSGLLIEANQASPLKKRYKCPTCDADAHVRMGLYRRPHFAHDSGGASNDCENYHPSEIMSRGLLSTFWNIKRHLPNLYVRLSDDPMGNPSSWDLMLLIPECPQSIGSVEITEAQYGTVTIPVTHLAQGGKRVNVRPEINYKIKVNGQVDPNYEEMITRPISGLDRICNVFQYSLSGGLKLHDNQTLFWGSTYFLVWNRNYEPRWLAGSEELLRTTNLSPNSEWHCDIIRIPAKEDFRVKKWAEEVLHRGIKNTPVRLSIVTPIVILTLDDESLLVSTTDEVILSITGELSAVMPSELHLKLSTDHTSISVKLMGPLPVLISLGQLPPGRTEIWLSDNQDIALSLCAVKFDHRYHIQGVGFTFEEPQQKRHVFTPVHSQMTQSLLNGVRQGLTSLLAVSIPRRVSATIRFRERSDTKWHELFMAVEYVKNEEENALRHNEFEERVLKEILEQLNNNKEELEIDFKNYGKVNLKSTIDRVLDTYTLPSYRRQLLWIISLLQSRKPTDKFSSGEGLKQLERRLKLIPIERFDSEDRDLINRLLKYNVVPITVEVKLRDLVKSIYRDLIDLESAAISW